MNTLGFIIGPHNPVGLWHVGHIVIMSIFLVSMIVLPILLKLFYKGSKNKVLFITTIVLIATELTRIVCILATSEKGQFAWNLFNVLPFFFCSCVFVTLPIATFTKGKLRQAMIDISACIGIIGSFMGTIFSKSFTIYDQWSIYTICHVATHCISGFIAIYLIISKMITFDGKSTPLVIAILIGLSLFSIIMNNISGPFNPDGSGEPVNYMYLYRSEATPFAMFYYEDKFLGWRGVYQLLVVICYVGYSALWWPAMNILRKKAKYVTDIEAYDPPPLFKKRTEEAAS